MFQKGFMKRSAKELKAVSKEYWQQEYHWHKEVETEKCGVSWCDVYDMTPWKAQCSYEGTGKCGAQAEYETRNQMDKTKIAKMDMEAFRQLKDAEEQRDKWREIALGMTANTIEGWESDSEFIAKKALGIEFERDRWKFIAGEARGETEKWCNLAGVMHQYLVDGDSDGALRAYEQAAIVSNSRKQEE